MNPFGQLCIIWASLFLSYVGFMAMMELTKIAGELKAMNKREDDKP